MITCRHLKPFAAAILLAGTLAACDEGMDVTREFPNTLGEAKYLQGLPPVLPVHFDAIPNSTAGEVRTILDGIATELSRGGSVRFAFGSVPDGREFALRIALQPKEGLSALSLCQGKPIGRLDAPQRSRTVLAAVCDNRRRLGEVRAVLAPSTGGGTDIKDSAIIEAAVRKLFALPMPG
ncbi:hypothetical protein EOI86_08575 [Hwanghaeella grinnelliae]|uniref:Uncharacterized protein n=1 Tax=Hwanghaeella grinnelliae TaxID=2500179 RepID=A0A3S2Y5W6_9PROT|nr:hypothetical protein [Hwanghaeella grinnelliae]RVU39281.1 hypothetical protein EOI86_08575 [Hwanghaeella grinnelliae]